MKLFVSALILVAAPFALAQNQVPSQGVMGQFIALQPGQFVILPRGQQLTPQQKRDLEAAQAKARARAQGIFDQMNQVGCPLYLKSASVAPAAELLPVSMRNGGDGALNLQFRNQSGKAIRFATITAHLKVKTNVYALDARPLEVQLSFSGTRDLDKEADQLTHIALPGHVYLFGVMAVTLDQVTYADGTFWIADRGANSCKVGGLGEQLLQAK
ncbi:MAG: hypothetical protein WA414_03315 [Acidobacteriaceae bacterium]